MAWPYTDPNDDPYGLLGGQQQPYGGLFGGMPGNDQNLALMSMGAGLIGARGRNTGEALGAGLQQGFGNLLNVSTLSGRQKALAEESAGREQDRTLRAQQMAAQQAAAQQRAMALQALIVKYPHLAPEIQAGIGDKFLAPFELSQGQQRFGPGGQPIASVPPKPPEASPLSKLIEEMNTLPPNDPRRALYMDAITKATTHQPAASITNYGSPVPIELPGGGIGYAQPPNRAGAAPQIMTGPTGQPLTKPPEAAKPPTDTERTAAGFADRMIASESIIERVGAAGIPTYGTLAAGSAGETARSVVMTPEQQMHRQAQMDWVRAKLRKESGAVIAKEEMADEIRTYFPMPGDKPETIAQKAKAREVATRAMMQQAGSVAPKPTESVQPKLPSGAGWRIVPK